MTRTVLASFLFLASVALGACGGDDTPPLPCAADDCRCTSTGCACSDGTACGGGIVVPSCNADGSSCALDCPAAQVCAAQCQSSCNASCAEGSTCEIVTGDSANTDCHAASCDFTLGASGSVQCDMAAECDVECGGSSCSVDCEDTSVCRITCLDPECSVTCAPDATCDLRCPGQTEFTRITGSGEC